MATTARRAAVMEGLLQNSAEKPDDRASGASIVGALTDVSRAMSAALAAGHAEIARSLTKAVDVIVATALAAGIVAGSVGQGDVRELDASGTMGDERSELRTSSVGERPPEHTSSRKARLDPEARRARRDEQNKRNQRACRARKMQARAQDAGQLMLTEAHTPALASALGDGNGADMSTSRPAELRSHVVETTLESSLSREDSSRADTADGGTPPADGVRSPSSSPAPRDQDPQQEKGRRAKEVTRFGRLLTLDAELTPELRTNAESVIAWRIANGSLPYAPHLESVWRAFVANAVDHGMRDGNVPSAWDRWLKREKIGSELASAPPRTSLVGTEPAKTRHVPSATAMAPLAPDEPAERIEPDAAARFLEDLTSRTPDSGPRVTRPSPPTSTRPVARCGPPKQSGGAGEAARGATRTLAELIEPMRAAS